MDSFPPPAAARPGRVTRARAAALGLLDGWAGFGRPIGVHFDGGVARLAQFPAAGGDRSGGPSAAAAAPVPPTAGGGADPDADARAAAALRATLAAYRFRGRRAVGCVPSGAAVVQTLRLPAAAAGETPAELAGLVRFELADRLPFPADDAEIRHLAPRPVRRNGEDLREVVVLAARRSAALATARLLAAAGLTCTAVEAEPLAAFRGLCERGEAATRAVVVHVGAAAVHVLLAEGPAVLMAKTLPGGAADLDAAVARHTGLPPAQAAATRRTAFAADRLDDADEVHRSVVEALRDPLERLANEVELVARHFRVLFRGAAAETLRAGGPHCPPWLAEYLGDHLGLPALTPDPAGGAGAGAAGANRAVLPGRAGEWAAACGLATRPDASAAGGVNRGLGGLLAGLKGGTP